MVETPVRLPHVRSEAAQMIRFLAGSDKLMVVKREDENGKIIEYMDFHTAVNWFFDHLDAGASSEDDLLGDVLRSEQELVAVGDLRMALNEVLGVDYPIYLDAEYVQTDRWKQVVASAKHVLSVLS
ncbi:SCO4402 family protein [Aminobacter carboxidus]